MQQGELAPHCCSMDRMGLRNLLWRPVGALYDGCNEPEEDCVT